MAGLCARFESSICQGAYKVLESRRRLRKRPCRGNGAAEERQIASAPCHDPRRAAYTVVAMETDQEGAGAE